MTATRKKKTRFDMAEAIDSPIRIWVEHRMVQWQEKVWSNQTGSLTEPMLRRSVSTRALYWIAYGFFLGLGDSPADALDLANECRDRRLLTVPQ